MQYDWSHLIAWLHALFRALAGVISLPYQVLKANFLKILQRCYNRYFKPPTSDDLLLTDLRKTVADSFSVDNIDTKDLLEDDLYLHLVRDVHLPNALPSHVSIHQLVTQGDDEIFRLILEADELRRREKLLRSSPITKSGFLFTNHPRRVKTGGRIKLLLRRSRSSHRCKIKTARSSHRCEIEADILKIVNIVSEDRSRHQFATLCEGSQQSMPGEMAVRPVALSLLKIENAVKKMLEIEINLKRSLAEGGEDSNDMEDDVEMPSLTDVISEGTETIITGAVSKATVEVVGKKRLTLPSSVGEAEREASTQSGAFLKASEINTPGWVSLRPVASSLIKIEDAIKKISQVETGLKQSIIKIEEDFEKLHSATPDLKAFNEKSSSSLLDVASSHELSLSSDVREKEAVVALAVDSEGTRLTTEEEAASREEDEERLVEEPVVALHAASASSSLDVGEMDEIVHTKHVVISDTSTFPFEEAVEASFHEDALAVIAHTRRKFDRMASIVESVATSELRSLGPRATSSFSTDYFRPPNSSARKELPYKMPSSGLSFHSSRLPMSMRLLKLKNNQSPKVVPNLSRSLLPDNDPIDSSSWLSFDDLPPDIMLDSLTDTGDLTSGEATPFSGCGRGSPVLLHESLTTHGVLKGTSYSTLKINNMLTCLLGSSHYSVDTVAFKHVASQTEVDNSSATADESRGLQGARLQSVNPGEMESYSEPAQSSRCTVHSQCAQTTSGMSASGISNAAAPHAPQSHSERQVLPKTHSEPFVDCTTERSPRRKQWRLNELRGLQRTQSLVPVSASKREIKKEGGTPLSLEGAQIIDHLAELALSHDVKLKSARLAQSSHLLERNTSASVGEITQPEKLFVASENGQEEIDEPGNENWDTELSRVEDGARRGWHLANDIKETYHENLLGHHCSVSSLGDTITQHASLQQTLKAKSRFRSREDAYRLLAEIRALEESLQPTDYP